MGTPPKGERRGGRLMNLTTHFTLEEMLHSETAEKKKIENRINAAEVDNLVRLCQKVLEPLRDHFHQPIHINSGFRCSEFVSYQG